MSESEIDAQLARIQEQVRNQSQEAEVQEKNRRLELSEMILAPRLRYHFRVFIPADLLTATHIGVRAKLIYGALQTLPSYNERSSTCWYTYTKIAEQLKMNIKTVRRALFKLRDEEWIAIQTSKETKNKKILTGNPVKIKMIKAKHNLNRAKFRGEALMREGLNLVLEWDNGVDNATPDYLKNPYTHEQMHFDRHYEKQNVAFEYNGEQHYHATKRYSQSDVGNQKRLDRIKQKICNERNIMLLIFRREDLSIAGITEKIKQALPWAPLRDLTGYDVLVNYLEKQMEEYRQIKVEKR